MDSLRIRGGRALRGSIRLSGAKNAALPALAAALLTDAEIVLRDVPRVRDVDTMLQVLEHLGASGGRDGSVVRLRFPSIRSDEAPYDLVRRMRASVLTLGPLLARHGRARVSRPGGCAIGARPVDLHVDVMRAFGADVRLREGYIEATAKRLRGAEYGFDVVTVTGTENALMAATLASGTSLLRNCAREPEIVDLANLLVLMGARIEGAGTDTIQVEGVEALRGAEHALMPDRIECGTFLVAAALAGDRVVIEGARPAHMATVLDRFRRCGVPVEAGDDHLVVRRAEQLTHGDVVTRPYPGFPTDLQAQFMALATQAAGVSVIRETIFENRFMHVPELARLGARIRVNGRSAFVEGPTPLSGAPLMATDLRASACLVLAGLVAAGETCVRRIYHLDRGYDHIEEKLRSLGADVERLSGPGGGSA
ncbi:MAG: UDP-N-acetylglucosamine 1-carboxyvinyltransferase [Acidobacteriota bacterium]